MVFIIVMVATMACSGRNIGHDTIVSDKIQQEVMAKANAAVPAYEPQKFPARTDINTYLLETEDRSEWYIYLLNKDGQPIFYMVSGMQPRNLCTSLTAPERIVDGRFVDDTGDDYWIENVVVSAPALDGVYYGGTDCGQTQYMTDLATGNFIQVSGTQFTLISSKVPLSLETDELVFGE